MENITLMLLIGLYFSGRKGEIRQATFVDILA